VLVAVVYVRGLSELIHPIVKNYRSKNVPEIGVSGLVLNALSVVADDCVAFTFKTPFLYRLASFRDDLVFGVFLFQWLLYRKKSA